MGLIRNYNLIDIKRYEEETGDSILRYFDKMGMSELLALVSLGNGKCTLEQAGEKLDAYLQDHTFLESVMEIKKALLGDKSAEEKSTEQGEEQEENDDENAVIDISNFESLTDLYINFSMQLMSVGLGYTEFWSMTTKEMYKVFDSILIKLQNETNRQLSNAYSQAAMTAQAVWGKLPSEPPQVKIANNRKEEEVEGMDAEDAMMVAKLKRFVETHNRREKENGR